MRVDISRRLIAIAGVMAIAVGFTACQSSKSNAAGSSANHGNNAELFTIPQDQMSHVQVLTVHPTTLGRSLRLTGAVAYNSFHTTPVITQVSGPVSKVVVVPRAESNGGGTHVVRGEPRLLAAPYELFES